VLKNPFFKSPAIHFLTESERDTILDTIKQQEASNSGEIIIYIESKNKWTSTLQRANEVFQFLQMHQTEHRNAVLIYIAYKDQEFAIFGDKGCIEKFPATFWKTTAQQLSVDFYAHQYAEGLDKCIKQIGDQLDVYFPYSGIKKNSLPDEIVFGK
jgi:uncharacterized membrane protein